MTDKHIGDERTTSGISYLSGGEGKHALLLLHGLAANAGVWRPMLPLIEREWHGVWLAPDFAGHGNSVHREAYSYQDHARDVLELVAGFDRVSVLGHSMGAVVGLAAAALAPRGTSISLVALSMKLSFQPEEIQWFLDRSKTQPQDFPTDREALQRYLKVAGLSEHAATESETAQRGIAAAPQGYRLAMDPKAYMVAGEKLPLVINEKGGLALATGSEDRIAPADDMKRLYEHAIVLEGLGHNAHVQDPETVWRRLSDHLT